MRNFLFTIGLMSVLGFTTTAQAGFMIEPYLGYDSSTLVLEQKSSGTDSGGKVSGVRPGLRLGYTLPVFVWFALDYSMLTGATVAGNTSSGDGKVDSSNLFVDVGFDFPVLARVWAGVGAMNTATKKPDSSGAASDLTFDSAIKLGVGFKMIPFVSLNIEYYTMNLKELETNGTKISVDSTYKAATDNGFLVSLSVPL